MPPRTIWQIAEVRTMKRRQFHVAGAAQDRGQRVHQPRQDRAAEEDLNIANGVRQHVAAATEQFEQCRSEDQHDQHESQAEAAADQQRMRGQRAGALLVTGAERPRDRRRHAAAHGATRHRHGQDHERKHQRHRRQQLGAEPADIGGFRDDHAGTRAERNDIRPCEPQQRAQNRAVDQRVSCRRRDRTKRKRLFVGYGNFSEADIGQFGLPARLMPRRGCFLAPIKAGSMCTGRKGGLRECRRGRSPWI